MFSSEAVFRSDVIDSKSVVAAATSLLFTLLFLFLPFVDGMSLLHDQVIHLAGRPINFLPLVDLCLFSSCLQLPNFFKMLMSS